MSQMTLIRPPIAYSKLAYSAGITPPLGLAYLAASLLEAGHRVDAIDCVGEAPLASGEEAAARSSSENDEGTSHPSLVFRGLSISEIVQRIDPASDGIGITVMYSQQWPHVETLIGAILERFPGKPIFVGGEHVTGTWQYILDVCPGVTACAIGEGEDTVVDLAEYLDGKKQLDEIAGLAIRNEGGCSRTEPRTRIRNVDAIPRPAWELFPIATYLDNGFSHGVYRGRTMPILATRGCPYRCTFCSSRDTWTQRYYVRDVADVVDEIEDYTRLYGATNIDFYDLTMVIKRGWILDFCEEVAKRDISITYQLPTGTRAEALDAEVLGALHRTGCRNICYAPESGSRRTLKRILKKASPDAILESILAAKKVGIFVKVNLMIGFPDETRREMWETLAYGAKLAWIGADDIPLFPVVPYAGTQLYDDLRAEGRIPPMDNDYFAGLGYMDLAGPTSLSQHVGPRELGLMRTLGMTTYLAIGYARRPWRILRTIRNVISESCDSVVEQRLIDIKRSWLGRTKSMLATAPNRGPKEESRISGT